MVFVCSLALFLPLGAAVQMAISTGSSLKAFWVVPDPGSCWCFGATEHLKNTPEFSFPVGVNIHGLENSPPGAGSPLRLLAGLYL